MIPRLVLDAGEHVHAVAFLEAALARSTGSAT